MELLIACLIAFGVITTEESKKISKSEVEQLVAEKDLKKDYIILQEAEADDFNKTTTL